MAHETPLRRQHEQTPHDTTDFELQPTAGMFASPQVNACMHACLRMESGTLLEPHSALRFSNERCTDMDSAWIAAL